MHNIKRPEPERKTSATVNRDNLNFSFVVIEGMTLMDRWILQIMILLQLLRIELNQLLIPFTITYTGHGISMDFNAIMGPELLEQYKDIEVDVTGTNVALPNNLETGQALPDADLNMQLDMGGIGLNINVQMIDRKVQGNETLTTTAGTFNCYVITYTSKFKAGIGRTGSAKQWIAEGVGLVKQEDYNRKGKLTGSSVLTAFSK